MALGLTSSELAVLVIAVFLIVIAIGLGLYVRARLQRRRAKLLGELQNRPQLIQDRAFNRIAMARREVELLARQGADVGRARERIAEAQASFDNRRYESAYETAQTAHESLVNARRGIAPPPSVDLGLGPGATGDPLPSPSGGPTSAFPASGPEAPSPTPAMPKNRAESQFQLRVLEQELAVARSDRPDEPSTAGAADLATQARSAFDRSDFTEAFRLALKGRRTLGGSIESLPLTPTGSSPAGAPGPLGLGGNGGARADVSETAGKVAGAARCPECGYPALPDDVFCRGCGRPQAPVTCPKCGVPKVPGDSFCGRCGAPFA